MKRLLVICLASLAVSAGAPARAVLPDEMLEDAALEARARDISKELRCVVCQNQTIDDSNAPLARDMRLLVRERLVAGDTDAEVKDYLVTRYGDFVLMRPPLKTETIFLWWGPLAFLVAGFLGFGLYFAKSRANKVSEVAPLTQAEEAALARVEENERA